MIPTGAAGCNGLSAPVNAAKRQLPVFDLVALICSASRLGRRRKRKHLGPRCKRMKRPARLQSAVSWLKQYSGKNVLRGYCKHYDVDWRCAATELKQLGVHLHPDYLKRREITEQQLAISQKKRREARTEDGLSDRVACPMARRIFARMILLAAQLDHLGGHYACHVRTLT